MIGELAQHFGLVDRTGDPQRSLRSSTHSGETSNGSSSSGTSSRRGDDGRLLRESLAACSKETHQGDRAPTRPDRRLTGSRVGRGDRRKQTIRKSQSCRVSLSQAKQRARQRDSPRLVGVTVRYGVGCWYRRPCHRLGGYRTDARRAASAQKQSVPEPVEPEQP
jgi:hypothetical protein